MFQIDKSANRMSKLPARTFSELGFKERGNLQEWLEETPDALGEELLIIQKEFDGFAETRERLDLLALDKDGSLVIIENKLDDSGRDVVWQALKYVAYCSSLKKSEIIKIFQDYLKGQNRSEDASELICDFLEAEAIEEVSLNSGSNQRFILVAADFRKEVTSTVLWLISNGIRGQCMKVILHALNDIPLLDINQIIPTPEAEDYMIGMSSKGSEENEVKTVVLKRQQRRIQFWEQALNYFREKNLELYGNVNPSKDPWLNTGSGISGCFYALIFRKSGVRVEFGIQRGSEEDSKRAFDLLYTRKDEIEKRFGAELSWERLDGKKSSRIRHSKDFDSYNEENWSEMIQWLFEHIRRLEIAFKPIIPDIPKK
ncbi:MAG: DUF4268 domain-containing protein [Alphaproteobacteria bacterium]